MSGSDNEQDPKGISKARTFGGKEKKSVTISEQKSKYGNMPQTMHDHGETEISGIDIDQMTLDELRDNFIKFLPEDAPGKLGDRLDPEYMKR